MSGMSRWSLYWPFPAGWWPEGSSVAPVYRSLSLSVGARSSVAARVGARASVAVNVGARVSLRVNTEGGSSE